ncbi:nuclear exosome regulator NRDE2 [Nasonia vitripennis]|uniref:Protein NRDE2 homolog n=1 Tax=Nasonia vitripennis TaxID=7425 RepID=A0A7M7QWG1_NASVI|nr:nuclear exosome regulator NRDE2 [Nasonia vitripennis]
MFYSLNKLERGLKPYYKLSNNRLGFKSHKPRKHKNFQRYHVTNLDNNQKKVKKDSNVKSNDVDDDPSEKTVYLSNFEVEDKQKVIIEEFNKKLAKDPNDVQAWIEYASFQDQMHSKHLKQIIKQKKLSIIEKGLAANHNSIKLLEIKLHLLAKLLPADEFCQQVEAMIQKDQKNIILWQALIKMTRTSCALCKVSSILDLYVRCFSIMKQRSKQNPKYYDHQVLRLLFQCLIFLRHAGLWEQMWEIIRINLCLNLPLDHDTLKSINTIDEKVLINMEELVLTSKLPLNQLWLRIESLRESCHWTSVDLKKVDISLIGDERRLVSAEETTDFIYPTISKDSSFRLIVFSLLSLKVPLLPTRHCTIKDLELEDYSWCIDSLESVLPMIYSIIWKNELTSRLSDKSVIADLLEGKLISGPQYLKFHPAQESFLEFIRSVFHTVAEKLPPSQRTSILIWWLRLERLLVNIAKSDALCATNRNKKLKSTIKSFLKKAENRNNLHFYREFALIEYELGSLDSCLQILKTVIQSQDNSSLGHEDKAALFSLYRTILEILLMSNSEDFKLDIFKDIMKSLKIYVFTCFNYDSNMSVEEMLYNEILRFLMNPITDELEEEFFLPNIYCDILLCYSYLLHYKSNNFDNVDDILDLCDRCLMHCAKCERLQERFYETKVTFIQFYQSRVKNISNVLIKTVREALDKYSCNFLLLSTNALFETELPFWKWKIKSAKFNIWSILASCLAGRARITYLRNTGLSDTYEAMINKMLAFHKAVSTNEEVQDCPLLWKLYMLLLQEHNLCERKGEDIYYEAVSQCPWARSVYISASEVAPQNLPQIQDLIKEKGLRMHVTLEELDILRE